MNNEKLISYVDKVWDESITPSLCKYIEIPNKSPLFDKEWKKNGYMDEAVKLIADWCNKHAPQDMKMEIIEQDNRTPLIYIEIPGQSDEGTLLMYGHLDKQPEMEGWDDDLGPWKAVIRGDKLYGRGGADDGYSAFASITAINALQQQGIPHKRCVILIEASEESGSSDLPYYVEKLKDKIGDVDLIICLDSGCGNYEQLWLTTSLRGIVGGTLKVQISEEGVHSGAASGIIPSSFRILRSLLDRVEDPNTGEITLPGLHAEIPKERLEQAKLTADVLKDEIYNEFTFVDKAEPVSAQNRELLLNRTWKSALSITGVGGIPALENAGNVLRPYTELKLSMRIPPTLNAQEAGAILKEALETNPPYNAKVTFDVQDLATGWNAPKESPWLVEALSAASLNSYGRDAQYFGEGGTIPFMGMLGEMFPNAQFVITGVLGPKSNAHGPNEFIHLAFAKKLTAAVAHVIASHFNN